MKTNVPLIRVFLAVFLLLSRMASANEITIHTFKANQSSTSLGVSPSGTPVFIEAIVQRPSVGASDFVAIRETWVAFYVGTVPPAFGSVPSTITANGTTSTGFQAIGTMNSTNTIWQTNPANPNRLLFNLTVPPFNLSANWQPGSGTRKLYMALIDPGTGTIFWVSTGITINILPAGAPSITSVTTPVQQGSGGNVTGTNLAGADGVLLYGANGGLLLHDIRSVFYDAGASKVFFTLPFNVPPGQYLIAIRTGMASNNTQVSNLLNFTAVGTPPPTTPPMLSRMEWDPGTNQRSVRIFGPVFHYWNITGVSFNGIITTNFTIEGNNYVVVQVPPGVSFPLGLTTGAVTVQTTVGGSNALYFPQNPVPFGWNAIGGDQIVEYGTVPRLIEGRILADASSSFRAVDGRWSYYSFAGYNGQSFGSGDRQEGAQWQRSFTGYWNDWQDISGATGRNYEPNTPCTQITYYRRVSSYLHYYTFSTRREEWYISSTVTISPSATIAPGAYLIHNRNTGQVLEIEGGSAILAAGPRARQGPSTGTSNQEWIITATSGGMYKITNRSNGKALEIGGGNLFSQGAPANLWPYWGGKNQQWYFQHAGSYFTITNANSGQVLEIGGGAPSNSYPFAQANQWPYQGYNSYAQEWELVPISVPTSSRWPGVFTIKNVNSNQLLEIAGMATNMGAPAQQWSNAGISSQQWTFVDIGGGLFEIINRHSGLALEIGGWAMHDGATAQQWAYYGGVNQKWYIDELSPGVLKITNFNSGKVLEIGGFSSAPGVAVTQSSYVGGTNQQWTFDYVSANRVANPSVSTAVQQPKGVQSQPMGVASLSKTLPVLSVYPNPASTTLNFYLSGAAEIASVSISDLRGSIVLGTHSVSKAQVDISALPAGAYIVTVSDGQRTYHQRVVKQ